MTCSNLSSMKTNQDPTSHPVFPLVLDDHLLASKNRRRDAAGCHSRPATCPGLFRVAASDGLRRVATAGLLPVLLLSHYGAAAEVLAFPGAEGFGRVAKGGRGGDVYHVTTLSDSGPGSLREGIQCATGPRTIVFTLSGNIELKSKLVVDKSNITLAGQTAPGDGITLRNYTFNIKNATNVIVRYLRFRLGDENTGGGQDTMTTDDIDHVILDHCSLSWAIDGTQDLRRGGNFTLQWCILSEALNNSLHNKGSHAMCASYRDLSGNISLHHNLFSTCRDRHPSLGSAKGPPQYLVDFRNNVIYNWSAGGTANFCDHFVNCVNNVWRPGPMSGTTLPIAMKGVLPDMSKGHMQGNLFEGRDDWTRDNYAALDWQRWLNNPDRNYQYRGKLADWKSENVPLQVADTPRTQPATEALELVLARAGASLRRDAVDVRVIDNVRNLKGKLIDSQKEVGGWPVLMSLNAPVDSDHDGMPDEWEKANGLNPNDPSDRNTRNANGYTKLEEYLNSLCAR